MTRLREALLWVLAGALPFAAAEVGLRLAGWRPASDWYFHGLADEGPPLVARGDRLEVAPPWRTIFRAEPFPIRRAPGEVRLVVLGDSVAWGHRSNEDPEPLRAWPDALQDLLRQRPGGASDRVVNLAARTWASLRVSRLLPQVLDLDPDAVVASFGSSEFLEEVTRRGWEARQARRPLWFWRLRVVEALEALVARLRGQVPRGLSTPALRERDDTLSAGYLRDQAAALDPGEAARRVAEAQARAAAMASLCQARGIPLVLLTVPSNLRWPPEASRHADPAARQEADEAVREGGRLLEAGEVQQALDLLTPMVARHPEVAALRFRLAQALDRAGRVAEARDQYESARDQSAFPLRAIGAFNQGLRQVAAAFPGVVLVDVEALARSWVPDGIPDDRLFLDQNHLTEAAHQRVAEAVLEALVARGIVKTTGGSP